MTYPDDWFERKVLARLTNTDQPDACWEWTGPLTPQGYGSVWLPGRTKRGVHRVTYTQLVGPIPDGLELDHLCRVRACANPAHLEPVTRRTNQRRGATLAADQVTRTTCPAGHRLDGDNLVPTQLAKGRRGCLTCARDQARADSAERIAARKALGLTYAEYCAHYGESAHVAREITRRLQTGEPLDGVRNIAPGPGRWGKRNITAQPDPTRT